MVSKQGFQTKQAFTYYAISLHFTQDAQSALAYSHNTPSIHHKCTQILSEDLLVVAI